MQDFHVIIRPVGNSRLVDSVPSLWRGETVAAWRVDAESRSLAEQSFSLAYETFAGELAKIPRLFLEPDGSFVWVSSDDSSRRISGQITDDGQRVLYLELRGRCLWNEMAAVLAPLRSTGLKLAFQLLPEALLIEELPFRELVCGDASLG